MTVNEFYSVCKRRKLKVNAGKSKVMVLERWEERWFNMIAYWQWRIQKIILNGEAIQEVNEFKYLGSVICKHGGTEGETRERTLQGRKVERGSDKDRPQDKLTLCC